MAGTPNSTTVIRQPTPASSHVPMSGIVIVPTLPPAMCALIANPRRSGGNCSESSALPTGCCGDTPTFDSTFAIENPTNDGARACAAMPLPNRTPPATRMRLRETTRVSPLYVSWKNPAVRLPSAVRNAICAAPTWYSSMITR